MEKFTVLMGLVAPLDRASVDTDAIIPKQVVKSIMRSGFSPDRIEVKLDRQTVTKPDGETPGFDIDSFRNYCLLNGLDDVGPTLRHAEKISGFEETRKAAQPWLFR